MTPTPVQCELASGFWHRANPCEARDFTGFGELFFLFFFLSGRCSRATAAGEDETSLLFKQATPEGCVSYAVRRMATAFCKDGKSTHRENATGKATLMMTDEHRYNLQKRVLVDRSAIYCRPEQSLAAGKPKPLYCVVASSVFLGSAQQSFLVMSYSPQDCRAS